ncbi:MAG TPA: integrase core domain-containing protein [bacterium]|nr:integrase core domain-containing protein [bacterium]HPQ66066.1 integrase core domain-containing protein [bacterium]
MPWKESDIVDERTEFVLKSMGRFPAFKELCAEYGISRKTGYKWKKRFLEEGSCGLHDRLRRPKSFPGQLGEETVCEMIRLKLLHIAWGPKKIRELYGRIHGEAPSLSSFKRVLDKSGLVVHRVRRRRRSPQRLSQPIPAQAPNDIWTVDFKGWWRFGVEQRCEPLTIRDDFSRYILAIRAMESTSTEKTKVQFEKVFERYGLPKIIRSDNGAPFASSRSPLGLSKLSAWWIGLGIQLDRIAPGHPEQNGGHERMHRDIRLELQGLIEGDLGDHQEAFDVWRRTFNDERPHEALKMRVPADVYKRSPRRYREVSRIEYPRGYVTRTVKPCGAICVNGRQIFISTALRGWNVGLKGETGNRMEVWFDYLRMGEIDLEAEAFICVA